MYYFRINGEIIMTAFPCEPVRMDIDQITIDLNPMYKQSVIDEKIHSMYKIDNLRFLTLDLNEIEFITKTTFQKLITDKFSNSVELHDGAPPIRPMYHFAFVEDASQSYRLYDGRGLTKKIIEHNKKKEVCINPDTQMPLSKVHYFRMKKLFDVVEYMTTTTFNQDD